MFNTKPNSKYRRAINEEYEKKYALFMAMLKEKAGKSLYLLNKYVLKVSEGDDNFVPLAPFHKQLCNFIQDRADKKKLVLIPRGHLKTKLVTIGYPILKIIQNPKTRVLIYSATWQTAVDIQQNIQKTMQTSVRLQELWGDIFIAPTEWSQDRTRLRANDKREPTLTAAGIDNNLVGGHYDLIIMDDVVNRDNIATQEQIAKVNQRYKDSLDLLEPGGEMVVIGTRWHDSDLYGWIMDPGNGVKENYLSMVKRAYEGNLQTGEDFVSLWPEKFTREELNRRLSEEGWYHFCTPKETPILMADFTIKEISKIKTGDNIIGFERYGSSKRHKLVQTKVKNVFEYMAPVYTLKMKSGRKVRCTKEHKWYTGRHSDPTHPTYAPAHIGSNLMFVCPVDKYKLSVKQKNAWFYLAGLFDGDGSAKTGGYVITQGSGKNSFVIDKLKETFKTLGIDYGEYSRKSNNYKWQDSKLIWFKNSFENAIKLIRITNLAKKDQIVAKLLKKGKRFVKEKDKVADMTFDGIEKVYALETETGNYIAWGYASSNSAQYLNNPVPEEDAIFKKDWFRYYEEWDVRGRLLNKFLLIDPALTTTKEADYTAMVIVGVDEWGQIFILDIVRRKLSPNELIDMIFFLREKWMPGDIAIETNAFQKTLAYSIRDDSRFKRRPFHFTELKTNDRSKEQRIRGLQPLYENAKIFHNKLLQNNVYLEDELIRFPRSQHDDIIDALAYALDIVFPAKQKAEKQVKRKWLY